MTDRIQGEDFFEVDGVRYAFIYDDEIYRRFVAGVPLEEIAEARGCSVSRIRHLIKREKEMHERNTMQDTVRALNRFDQMLVRIDPTGTSAVTMAYLQPMRNFLEKL